MYSINIYRIAKAMEKANLEKAVYSVRTRSRHNTLQKTECANLFIELLLYTNPIILLSEYSFLLFINGAVILKKVLPPISLGKIEVCSGRVLLISIPQEAKYLKRQKLDLE
jgi:hypothetical protein